MQVRAAAEEARQRKTAGRKALREIMADSLERYLQ
jgi:hypothetical protein